LTSPSENPFIHLRVRSLLLRGILLLFGLSFGLGIITAATRLNPTDPILFPVLYILFFALLCLWELGQFNRLRINPKHVIGRSPNQQQWLPVIGLVIVVLIFSMGAFLLSFYALSFTAPTFVESVLESENLQIGAEESTSLYNILTVLVVVGVAPPAEEFIFRGVLLNRWAAKWGIRPALVLSSLVFGILHANVIGLFVFGLVMGLLYIRTRTLWVPIACHALNNAIALSLGLVPENASNQAATVLEQLRSQWWMGSVLLILSAPVIIWFLRHNWPVRHAPSPYLVNASAQAR
jgi:uncharacterized protein